MIGLGIYTTEGVPLYLHGNQPLASSLVPFIDKYGLWVAYFPAIERGELLCYIGARFDNVKESPIGRLNREVLLLSFSGQEKGDFETALRVFMPENLQKIFREAGLYFEQEPVGEPNVSQDSIVRVYREVRSYLRELSSEVPSSISKIPYRKVTVPGITDTPYPSLYQRYLFLGTVLEAIKGLSTKSCIPHFIENALRSDYSRGGDFGYPFVVYSKGTVPSLGGLWFPTGGM
ncbi:hypothetical protein [Thermococcus sp.]|uniref:hypothetical protein n=1 Tax=Thermococcus sp. TaxID=35749 RepID=UPI00262A8D1C|nr:hypothetical protein [Thermococcus sp.]